MSIQYDTSGNLNFPYDSIINIGGYQYQPILTISSFISVSGFVYPINVRPPIYYRGGGIRNSSISGIIFFSQTNDFYTDIISNRMKSTFLNGFLTMSGNINFKNNSSIIDCQNFNGIPTSFFNQLLTISSQIYSNLNYQNNINNYNNQAFLTLSSSIYNIPNYQNQINSLSSRIYYQASSLLTTSNTWTNLNTFGTASISTLLFSGGGGNSMYYDGISIFYINVLKSLKINISLSANLSYDSVLYNINGLTILQGSLIINNTTLTETNLGYLTTINSPVQQQFNTLSSLIYLKPSGLTLLTTNNTWSGSNLFNQSISLNGYRLLFRSSIDNAHYIGFGDNLVDGPTIRGYGGVGIGFRNRENACIIDVNGLTINGGNIILNNTVLTNPMISYLSNVSSDIQNQFNTISNQIYNYNRNTLSFNSSSVTYNNSQIGNNQFIIYNGFSDSTLTVPSCNSIRSGQIINVSNTQNIQTIANGNFIYPLNSTNNNYTTALPSWTTTGVIIQQSGSYFFPSGSLPTGPNYYQSIAIQTNPTPNPTGSFSQNVYLNTGVSTLSFYAGPRQSPYYTTSNYFNVSIGGTIVISNTTFSANQNWTLYTVNYTASNVGNYNLIISVGGCTGDSSISFANITIITPNNNRILTINATDYQPNLNGFNNGEFPSTSNISLQKNESVMLINDGKNYTKVFTNIVATSGTTLQTRAFSSRNYTLTNTSVNTNLSDTEIFGYNFTPKSSNSSIYVTFDAFATIGGSGSNDSFQTRLIIGNFQCGYKNILVPDYQRNRTCSLFPISGHRTNTALTAFRVVIDATRGSGDDVIDITSPAWSCLITEIQN